MYLWYISKLYFPLRILEAIKDLDKALELSKGLGAVGCQALVQRGLLHRLGGEDGRARDCFTRAADLGSTFAKTQVCLRLHAYYYRAHMYKKNNSSSLFSFYEI